MERKQKTVFQLDSPFTTVQWPQISSRDQETILELLLSLLSPISQHRSNHVTSSKGKRNKKIKRLEGKLKDPSATSTPLPPDISSFLVVGLNSITRRLELSSQSSGPKSAFIDKSSHEDMLHPREKRGESKLSKETFADDGKNPLLDGHFSVIFVCRSSQPTILHDHLPQLITTASLAYPELPATKLVELPSGSEARLGQALRIPKVSFIGILEGAAHSKSLVDLVRECVPEIKIPWLQEASKSKYLPVKINAIESFLTR